MLDVDGNAIKNDTIATSNHPSKLSKLIKTMDDDLRAQANAMLEAHLSYDPQLLAATKSKMEEQIAADPESFRRSLDNTPKGKIERCRNSEISKRQYQVIIRALDDPINKQLFLDDAKKTNSAENSTLSYPAVDLGCGSAYFTSQYALRYHKSLVWYPTDTKHTIQQFTIPCLKYLLTEEEKKKEEEESPTKQQCSDSACFLLLCKDRNGDNIYPNERVILEGLKTVRYNGRKGTVLHKDPKIDGRFAIILDDDDDRKSKPISFKSENFIREETVSGTFASKAADDKDIYQGLLDRTCQFDLLQRESRSELLNKIKLKQNNNNKCALVTCTNLLSEIGHREGSNAWKIVMEVASKKLLLSPGGLLLQGDTDGWGQFGNIPIMEEHAKPLGLTLHTHIKLDGWVLVLWKKH